jgi:hypothetical protein
MQGEHLDTFFDRWFFEVLASNLLRRPFGVPRPDGGLSRIPVYNIFPTE